MKYTEGIGSKCEMSLVVPHSQNHKVLGKNIIGYPRSNLSNAKGEACPRQVEQMDALCDQWVIGAFGLEIP